MQIMQRIEACPKNFPGSLQMVQIGAGKMTARVTPAQFVRRCCIKAVPAVPQLDDAMTRK
jgi:hypothetical protein